MCDVRQITPLLRACVEHRAVRAGDGVVVLQGVQAVAAEHVSAGQHVGEVLRALHLWNPRIKPP